MGSVDRETAHSTDNGRPDVNLQANVTVAAVTTILDRDLVKGSKGRIVILTDLKPYAPDLMLDDAQWTAPPLLEAAHPDASLSVDVTEAKRARPSHPQLKVKFAEKKFEKKTAERMTKLTQVLFKFIIFSRDILLEHKRKLMKQSIE